MYYQALPKLFDQSFLSISITSNRNALLIEPPLPGGQMGRSGGAGVPDMVIPSSMSSSLCACCSYDATFQFADSKFLAIMATIRRKAKAHHGGITDSSHGAFIHPKPGRDQYPLSVAVQDEDWPIAELDSGLVAELYGEPVAELNGCRVDWPVTVLEGGPIAQLDGEPVATFDLSRGDSGITSGVKPIAEALARIKSSGWKIVLPNHAVGSAYVFKHPQPKRSKSFRIYESPIEVSDTEPVVNNMLPRTKRFNVVQVIAIQEHSYFASLGCHETNYFALRSYSSIPAELNSLIDSAHELGLFALGNIVHNHVLTTILDGLNRFYETDDCCFHFGTWGYQGM
ncbi:hypothetical protein Nepgr_012966 [Nepenthes gracilis]|uniref:Uncharacterized protein n=1 Tax=Nepenthes gracilis TaxID=150966 RepID=A0AAD3SHV6_NEPGR|nr:hypothetical protein Nepgr_012966 [Nepenthes gracilis]